MLAIIIVSYKSNEQTVKYVQKISGNVSLPHKIVVVNNGAMPGDSEDLAACIRAELCSVDATCDDAHPQAFVIDNPENSGFAKGNNIGARFAIDSLHADKLLFSNNDIRLLDEDVVDKMATVLDNISEAGIVGPKIVGLDGRLQSPEPYMSFAQRHIWMYLCTPFISKERKRELFAFDYAENAAEGFHYKLMGSFFMVRSIDFANCGMMDEGTFLYSEEPILTERMASIGLKPYYLPSVSVLHEHSKTISRTLDSRKQDALQFESEVYYYRKYKAVGRLQVLIARLIRSFLYIAKLK